MPHNHNEGLLRRDDTSHGRAEAVSADQIGFDGLPVGKQGVRPGFASIDATVPAVVVRSLGKAAWSELKTPVSRQMLRETKFAIRRPVQSKRCARSLQSSVAASRRRRRRSASSSLLGRDAKTTEAAFVGTLIDINVVLPNSGCPRTGAGRTTDNDGSPAAARLLVPSQILPKAFSSA
jgi:hypothetical protein